MARKGEFLDVAGLKFGRWAAIEIDKSAQSVRRSATHWICRCECGQLGSVALHSLRSGGSKSCGCRRDEMIAVGMGRKHGLARSKAYTALQNAIKRCTNPKSVGWSRYGGRGIKICQRWLDSPENFVNDMGNPPPGMTLERVNLDGDYEPSNCIWATRTHQARNRRSNRLITFGGQTKCVAEWSEITGLPVYAIINRLNGKWSAEETLTLPLSPLPRSRR